MAENDALPGVWSIVGVCGGWNCEMKSDPEVLGLKRSFGFGDRLGLATPGHIEAVSGTSFLPIFAQQSVRELERTDREPTEVIAAAKSALSSGGWDGPWGADADHLQTQRDVRRMASAGFCFFTIDPSSYVNNAAESLDPHPLQVAYDALVKKGLVRRGEAEDLYLGKTFEIAEGLSITFDDPKTLKQAVVKYGGALSFTKRMAGWIGEACHDRSFEVEMSVDETLTPTTVQEHLFVGLELKRLAVRPVSVALRFIGDFEKGIDYKGDLEAFEAEYAKHVAIAKHCGPYKLSIHSGSDKFSIYPVIGRLSGEHLHVKTAGTSYLEALRVVSRTDRALFSDIVGFCRSRYETDKATYHVSAALGDVPDNTAGDDFEAWYLEHPSGRQILHVTYGSVLVGGQRPNGAHFKEAILENLAANGDLYRELLAKHLGKHLALLEGRAV